MGFLGIGKPHISDSTTVGITETGKREVERFSSNGEGFRILALLDDRSPQVIGNLRRETGLSINEIEDRVKALFKQGYIRFTGSEDA
jgi:DNA-binding MarR family transcriptional regulator